MRAQIKYENFANYTLFKRGRRREGWGAGGRKWAREEGGLPALNRQTNKRGGGIIKLRPALLGH